MVKAHNIQQYDKWKAWGLGEVKNSDMIILATTYIYEINTLCFKHGLKLATLSDNEAFKLISDNITPPK